MATVSKELADTIIRNDGHYKGDPRVMQVVKYTNMANQDAYAILYKQDVTSNRYAASEYVRNPQILWQAT